MAVRNYGIHDKWTNINKVNNVEIQSVDGVIENILVNGEPAGGGGGGDFTVANVTITQIGEHYADLSGCCCYTEDDENFSAAFLDYEVVNKVILYKGSAMVNVNNRQGTITVSGNAVYNESSETIMVTGDCTITIS